MCVVRQIFKKSQKMLAAHYLTVIQRAHVMRMATTKRSEKSLTTRRVKEAALNGNQESELQVSKRPQFRASTVMALALALYNLETGHTVSQTMNMALRQFLPSKYVTQAEQLARNRREQSA
jgi:hypothetical protein